MKLELSTFCPKDDEAVIWRFDENLFTPEYVVLYRKWLQEFFPNNPIICMPTTCSLQIIKKEELNKNINEPGQN